MYLVQSKRELFVAVLQDLFGVTAAKLLFSRSGPGTKKNKPFGFWLLVLVMHATLIGLLFWVKMLYVYVLYYAVLGTLYPLFNRWRVYGQHVELRPSGEAVLQHSRTSRTIDAGWLDRLFVTSKLMMYHHEHHESPTLPFRALGKICQRHDDLNAFSSGRWMIMAKFFRGLR